MIFLIDTALVHKKEEIHTRDHEKRICLGRQTLQIDSTTLGLAGLMEQRGGGTNRVDSLIKKKSFKFLS